MGSQSEEGWEEEEEGGATALAISSSFHSFQDLSEEEESGQSVSLSHDHSSISPQPMLLYLSAPPSLCRCQPHA